MYNQTHKPLFVVIILFLCVCSLSVSLFLKSPPSAAADVLFFCHIIDTLLAEIASTLPVQAPPSYET